MPRSQSWKKLEKDVADALKGRRVLRGGNFAVSDVDVEVPDMPHLRIDAKYRAKSANLTFIKTIEQKYCTQPEHVAVLVTKGKQEQGAIVCLRLEHFAALLDAIRELRDGATQT